MKKEKPPVLFYLDRHCAVVEKPGGLLAVPGRGPEKSDCMAARLRALCPWCIEQPAVHRLDMDTSGLMVFGLSGRAHRELSRQFACRKVAKGYVALLQAKISGESGWICLKFRLDPLNRPHQVYDPEYGKLGVTWWQKIADYDGKSLVVFWPQTGRTHQLRLHASHHLGLGCPIMGDRLYGTAQAGEELLLHAAYLAFTHPENGRPMRFFSPAPFWPAQTASANWLFPSIPEFCS